MERCRRMSSASSVIAKTCSATEVVNMFREMESSGGEAGCCLDFQHPSIVSELGAA